MKIILSAVLSLILISSFFYSFNSARSAAEITDAENAEFDLNTYWYSGKAEITSYTLKQARYGEIHEGNSVLVFVTEPFNTDKYVKSDYGSEKDVSVPKLNNTRKFTTGIYPYSMMTSSFLPFENPEHSFKVNSSSQEWCGHTYMSLENRDEFDILIESYFENESKFLSLEKTYLEDDFWSKIRLNPEELPIGEITVIPSFFFLRMKHADCKGYDCVATLTPKGKESTYSIDYKNINRTLSITFETEGAHKILGWEEEFKSGFGANSKTLKTEGTLLKTIQSDYWNKNKTSDSYLRTELGLE